jgi:hypothetical protein
VLLLLPGLNYDGIAIEKTIRAVEKLPVFFGVTDGDAYAHSSSLQLQDWAEAGELRVYRGATHGTDILSTSANVAEQMLLWLRPILAPARVRPQDAAGVTAG